MTIGNMSKRANIEMKLQELVEGGKGIVLRFLDLMGLTQSTSRDQIRLPLFGHINAYVV